MIRAFSTGEDISCSHSRSQRFGSNVGKHFYYYFEKSWLPDHWITCLGIKVSSDCQPIGYECVNYETFIEGRCADCRDARCQPMGINADFWINHKPNQKTFNYKYYLNTGVIEEFCGKSFKVIWKLVDLSQTVCTQLLTVHHYQMAFHITQDSDQSNGLTFKSIKFTLFKKKSI